MSAITETTTCTCGGGDAIPYVHAARCRSPRAVADTLLAVADAGSLGGALTPAEHTLLRGVAHLLEDRIGEVDDTDLGDLGRSMIGRPGPRTWGLARKLQKF